MELGIDRRMVLMDIVRGDGSLSFEAWKEVRALAQKFACESN